MDQARGNPSQGTVLALNLACRISYENDLGFRGCLKDGVLLCMVMNAVCPGSILKIWEQPRPHGIGKSPKLFRNVITSVSSAIWPGGLSCIALAKGGILSFCSIPSIIQEQMFEAGTQYSPGARSSPSGSTGSTGSSDPVLESVLANLTQEYERRLMMKDQEVVSSREKMATLAQQMAELQDQITDLRQELGRFSTSEEPSFCKTASRPQWVTTTAVLFWYEVEDLEFAVAENQAVLLEREQQLNELSSRLDAELEASAKRTEQLEEEVQELRLRLEGAELLEAEFRAVLMENKKLYNTVQDLKGSIRVFCRIRPLGTTGDQGSSCMNVDVEADELAIYEHGKSGRKLFKFDQIFDSSSSQADVYGDAQQLIRSVLDGYNVCIFAYGQTGSGKTHTMSGSSGTDPDGRGINYRALDDLFQMREQRSGEVEYKIKVQMLEIYNETLRDLLSEDQSSAGNRLDILNTQASGCNVPNATQMEVCCPSDVAIMMQQGAKNRHSAETRMNERSSRSHQILTVIVDGFNKITRARSHGCLHLVDLAGSERVSKSEATGDRMIEAQHINRSLSALGDVMAALGSKDKQHVPFRNSKLTQLLAVSLSGQGKVMMFMHASPESSSYAETLSTLKFAARVSEVSLGQAKKNVESTKAILAEEEASRLRDVVQHTKESLEEERRQKEALQKEVESLKAQLEAARRAPVSPWGSEPDHCHDTPSTASGSATVHWRPNVAGEVQWAQWREVQGAQWREASFHVGSSASHFRISLENHNDLNVQWAQWREVQWAQWREVQWAQWREVQWAQWREVQGAQWSDRYSGPNGARRASMPDASVSVHKTPLSKSEFAKRSSSGIPISHTPSLHTPTQRPSTSFSARPSGTYTINGAPTPSSGTPLLHQPPTTPSSANLLPKPTPSAKPLPASASRMHCTRNNGIHTTPIPSSFSPAPRSFSLTSKSATTPIAPQSAAGRRSFGGGWRN
eukprot:gene11916-15018_t